MACYAFSVFANREVQQCAQWSWKRALSKSDGQTLFIHHLHHAVIHHHHAALRPLYPADSGPACAVAAPGGARLTQQLPSGQPPRAIATRPGPAWPGPTRPGPAHHHFALQLQQRRHLRAGPLQSKRGLRERPGGGMVAGCQEVAPFVYCAQARGARSARGDHG
jgi:hypothetical protein